MKVTKIQYEKYVKYGNCPHVPYSTVKCNNGYNCMRCEIADRVRIMRKNDCSDLPLFYWRDCIVRNSRYGGNNFYQKIILLTEEAMQRLGLEVNLYNQFVYAYDGPGCLPGNCGSQIDIYLCNDHSKKYTITRFETYGVPTEQTLEKFDDLFFLGLKKYLNK